MLRRGETSVSSNLAAEDIGGGKHFRPDVEGVRAVAILLVVAYHAGVPGWAGGYIGVDVFFVVSGYLITGLLVHEAERSGRVSMWSFYARRARRLLPACAVTLLVTIGAERLLLSPPERELHARAATAAALYVSNIWFQLQSASYFSPDISGNTFLHTWSLAVEEQFYLIWPILIAVTLAVSRSRRMLAMVMLTASIISLAACLWLKSFNQLAAFYGSPARAWEFGTGGVAALVPAAVVFRLRAWGAAVAGLGFLMIVGAAVVLTSSASYPGVATIVPVGGTAAVLVGGAAAMDQGVSRVLGARPFQGLGRLSYSWYLWHWPVLALGATVVPALALPGRLALALGALGLATVSHILVENPIRFSRYLATRPALTLGLAALITSGSVAASRRAKASAVAEAGTPAQRSVLAAAESRPQQLYDRGCMLDYRVESPGNCTFGDLRSGTTVALFGDSHAAQWFSAYEAVAKERGWRLIAFTKSGCPSARVTVVRFLLNQPYPQCTAWREAVLRRILILRPALVVIANSDNHVSLPDRRDEVRVSLQQWRDGLHATLALLDGAGIGTIVLRDTPAGPVDVPICLSRAISHRSSSVGCSLQRSEALREDVFRSTRVAATGLSHVALLDLSQHFCDDKVCAPMRNDMIVYRDASHITDSYARSLAPYVYPR